MRLILLVFVVVALTACGAVKASYQVTVTSETLAIVKARPEFSGVECAPGTRIAVVGAEVSQGGLLLSVNCIDF